MNERKDTNIWPGLAYADALAQRQWLRDLGFDEGILVDGDADGEVKHSEMLWPDGGRVMIHSANLEGKTGAQVTGAGNIYVVVTDPDAVFERAQKIGATLVRPMRDEEYGSRGFTVSDPEGNAWSFGTYAG